MEALITIPAAAIAMCAAALYFLTGLLTGVWKYYGIRTSPTAEAPYYVNIAHRSALLYSFAAVLLALFASLSALPDRVNSIATTTVLIFFGIAIARYIYLGIKNETDNQHRNPAHPTGELVMLAAFIIGEIGGFLILLTGFLMRLLQV